MPEGVLFLLCNKGLACLKMWLTQEEQAEEEEEQDMGSGRSPSVCKDLCPDGGSESQDMIELRFEQGHAGFCERNRLWTGEGGSGETRTDYTRSRPKAHSLVGDSARSKNQFPQSQKRGRITPLQGAEEEEAYWAPVGYGKMRGICVLKSSCHQHHPLLGSQAPAIWPKVSHFEGRSASRCVCVRAQEGTTCRGGGVGTGHTEEMNSMCQFDKVRASGGLPRTQGLKIVPFLGGTGVKGEAGQGLWPGLGVTFRRPQSTRVT